MFLHKFEAVEEQGNHKLKKKNKERQEYIERAEKSIEDLNNLRREDIDQLRRDEANLSELREQQRIEGEQLKLLDQQVKTLQKLIKFEGSAGDSSKRLPAI